MALLILHSSGSGSSARGESPWVGDAHLTAAVGEKHKGRMYRFCRWIAARWLRLGNSPIAKATFALNGFHFNGEGVPPPPDRWLTP